MTPPDWPAWVNGQLVPTAEAAVSLHDRGLRGDGVFTTILVHGGVAMDLDLHLGRLRAALRELRLPPVPSEVVEEAVGVTSLAASRPLARTGMALRVVVTPGPSDPAGPFPPGPHPAAVPTVVVTAHPLGDGDHSVSAVTSPRRRPLPTVKSLSYGVELLALREAKEAGADTAILVDEAGHVLEGATTAVAAVVGGVLVSPPDDGRILPSTSLPRLLRAAEELGMPVARRAVHRAELLVAEGAVLVSAVSGVRHLEALDGVELGHSRGLSEARHGFFRLQNTDARDARRNGPGR